MAFSIWVMNCFGDEWRLGLCNMVNILSATELYFRMMNFMWCKLYYTQNNILMEHHSLCDMHINANLFHFLLTILLGLVVLVIFQVVAILICLLLVMHSFQCYQGHMYTGFETIKVWWCKQPYLLSLQQLYYCRSVGKRVRGSRFGLSRRPGK